MRATCAPRVELHAIPGLPVVEPGDDLAALLVTAMERAGMALASGDVLVLASKLVSRAEDRFVDLATVTPSPRAHALAATTAKDPRVVELILQDSVAVSRAAPDVLIVRHRLGFVCANAGIDMSNAQPAGAPEGSGPWALLLPRDPDGAAERVRAELRARCAVDAGVVISDSLGRPFRLGTVGAAIGVAGVPALNDLRGQVDLFGRELEHTVTALADQIAAAADLVAGQSAEGRGAILVRGVAFEPALPGACAARDIVRPAHQDLYA